MDHLANPDRGVCVDTATAAEQTHRSHPANDPRTNRAHGTLRFLAHRTEAAAGTIRGCHRAGQEDSRHPNGAGHANRTELAGVRAAPRLASVVLGCLLLRDARPKHRCVSHLDVLAASRRVRPVAQRPRLDHRRLPGNSILARCPAPFPHRPGLPRPLRALRHVVLRSGRDRSLRTVCGHALDPRGLGRRRRLRHRGLQHQPMEVAICRPPTGDIFGGVGHRSSLVARRNRSPRPHSDLPGHRQRRTVALGTTGSTRSRRDANCSLRRLNSNNDIALFVAFVDIRMGRRKLFK